MASNITDENQKRATLLYSAGKRVQEIHNTISTSNNSYSDTVEKRTAHFTPAMNIPIARHLFREATQRSNETTLQHVTRLRELSSDCDFGVDTDGHIRYQVIEICCNKTLRLKYITNIDITLKKILEMAQADETAHRHASEFENSTASGNVNYTQSSQGKYECYFCWKLGHFARNCRSKIRPMEGGTS